MIFTVTLNPAIDCAVGVENYTEGRVNRADYQRVTAGGKGINISEMLNRLGVKTLAKGFCGGETGELLCRLLDRSGCPHSMTFIEGQLTRINMKLKSGDCETEVNGRGTEISADILKKFTDSLCAEAKDGDTVVLAGSIPPSVPFTAYADIIRRFQGRNVRIAVDTSGRSLSEVLPLHPFLVKPNNYELGEILSTEISTRTEALEGAEKLQEMGAENVLVSLAGDGAVLLTSYGKKFETDAPKGTVRNSVGAGDSMLAGFLAGLEKTGDFRKALLLGTACGSATAFSDGLAELPEISEICKNIPEMKNSLF